MHMVPPLAVVNAHETERDLHKLHTFEYRLSRLYTWPQQAKKGKDPKEREKPKKYGANAPQLHPIWPQAA